MTSDTLPTHGPLFVGLLVGTVVLVGALTFFPALALGPIVEHYLMQDGQSVLDLAVFVLELIYGHARYKLLVRPPLQHRASRGSLLPSKLTRARPLFDPEIVRRATQRLLRQTESRHAAEEPGYFRGGGRCRARDAFPRARCYRQASQRNRLRAPDCAVALVHGAVCELRGSNGRSARQSTGRHAAQDEDRLRGETTAG